MRKLRESHGQHGKYCTRWWLPTLMWIGWLRCSCLAGFRESLLVPSDGHEGKLPTCGLPTYHHCTFCTTTIGTLLWAVQRIDVVD